MRILHRRSNDALANVEKSDPKIHRAFCLWVLTLAMICGQSLAAQVSGTVEPNQKIPATWLEGKIGPNRSVRMFIEENPGFPKFERIWGMYYDIRDRIPIPLDGERISLQNVRVHEYDATKHSRSETRFDLNFTDPITVSGTLTFNDGQETLPVSFRRVKQPAEFGEAIKHPQHFTDPRWPIEITYPTGWLLEVNATELRLRSPDPEKMIYDQLLRCEHGIGLPRIPRQDDEPNRFKGEFVRTRYGWRLDTTGVVCEWKHCPRPETRRVGKALIMTGFGAHSVYTPWGRAGLGDGREYLIIDGNKWAHCYDRVLNSNRYIRPRIQANQPTKRPVKPN